MKALVPVAALALLVALPACKQEVACTPERLDQATTELMVAVQAFAGDNPDRMGEIGPKVADLVARAGDAGTEPGALCDEVAALMGEVGG